MENKTNSLKQAEGPKGGYFLGNLKEYRKDPLELFIHTRKKFGDIARLRLFNKNILLLSHPDAIKYVIQTNNRNFDKGTHGYQMLKEAIGNGLLTSEGDFWRRQRRLAQPAFYKQRLASFFETMEQTSREMTLDWDKLPDGHLLEVSHEMLKVTLRIVGKTLLGKDLGGDARDIGDALNFVMHRVNERITQVLVAPLWMPTPANKKFKKNMAILNSVVQSLIIERREAGEGQFNDLLAMLVEAKDLETGQKMNDQQLQDEVLIMFSAGHETTANAMTWTLLLLAQHPEISQKLFNEVKQAFGDSKPEISHLSQLKYCKNVIQESMRIYPPAWLFGRRAVEDDIICGFEIKKGEYTFISPYLTHRHPEFWEEPEKFQPERFDSETVNKHPKFTYLPFGGGPRQCIGNNFALMEMQILLALIIQKYNFELLDESHIKLDPVITLRPLNGLYLKLNRRK